MLGFLVSLSLFSCAIYLPINSISSSSSNQKSFSSSSKDKKNLDEISVYFGENAYDGDNQSGEISFEYSGFNSVKITSSNCYFNSTENSKSSIRLGNKDNAGLLNFSFASSFEIDSIFVNCYSEEPTVDLAFKCGSYFSSGRVKEESAKNIHDYESDSWLRYDLVNQTVVGFSLFSLSDASNYVCYISKIVILTKKMEMASSSSSQSSSSSYGESSSSSSSFSSSSSVSSPSQKDSYVFRLPRVKVSGNEANVYEVSQLSDGTFSSTIKKTINRNSAYIEPDDVAAYYQAFDSFPVNYCGSDKSAALEYGSEGRCYFTYAYGSYTGANSYTEPLGPWANKGATYYELDISTSSYNPSYNNGSKISRGTYRLVIVIENATTSYPNEEGGYDSICFFTKDHYSNFYEYLNYYGGWGERFQGTKNNEIRPSVTTISL